MMIPIPRRVVLSAYLIVKMHATPDRFSDHEFEATGGGGGGKVTLVRARLTRPLHTVSFTITPVKD